MLIGALFMLTDISNYLYALKVYVDIGPGRCNLRLKSRNDLRKIGGSNLFNYKTEQD